MAAEQPSERRSIRLARDAHLSHPALDTAVSRAILERVAAGQMGETFRLFTPGRVVAFGRQDVVSAGYRRAVQACGDQGFGATERLAGGRAAVFHEGTLAFTWAIPTADPLPGIKARFDSIDKMITRALQGLGCDARVGEVPGEYCPGRYSVNLGGRFKVMGVGQRLRRGVAHLGGVLVVSGRELINRVLVPVYRELDIQWNPAATGSLRCAISDITPAQVAEALIAELSAVADIAEANLDATTVEMADRYLNEHMAPL